MNSWVWNTLTHLRGNMLTISLSKLITVLIYSSVIHAFVFYRSILNYISNKIMNIEFLTTMFFDYLYLVIMTYFLYQKSLFFILITLLMFLFWQFIVISLRPELGNTDSVFENFFIRSVVIMRPIDYNVLLTSINIVFFTIILFL